MKQQGIYMCNKIAVCGGTRRNSSRDQQGDDGVDSFSAVAKVCGFYAAFDKTLWKWKSRI